MRHASPPHPPAPLPRWGEGSRNFLIISHFPSPALGRWEPKLPLAQIMSFRIPPDRHPRAFYVRTLSPLQKGESFDRSVTIDASGTGKNRRGEDGGEWAHQSPHPGR